MSARSGSPSRWSSPGRSSLSLGLGSALATRRLTLIPSKGQTLLELVVSTVDSQIRDTMQTDPAPFRALIGSIFLFTLVSNWSSLIPGVEPPTAHIETDAAMALIIFVATIGWGVRTPGVGRLSRDLRRADLGHDPAQHRRAVHPHLLADRAPVRQRDERRVHHRHHPDPRGPPRADPADGARSAHRRRAGLHFRGPCDRVHRRRGRRAPRSPGVSSESKP